MNEKSRLHGVWSASLTPLRSDFSIDLPLLVEHCRWQLARGCHGIALFGTTGEGTSFGVGERKAALEAVVAAGSPAPSPGGGGGGPAFPATDEFAKPGRHQGCRPRPAP